MHTQLKIFREERGLEFSCGNLPANITEELQELLVAIYNNDAYETIDALCDIVVFVINGIEAMGYCAKSYLVKSGQNAEWLSPTQTASVIFAEMGLYINGESLHRLASIANACLEAVEALGYSSSKCMLETCKEINSREGEHNASKGKWCKFTDLESKAKWYKADYASCKRG